MNMRMGLALVLVSAFFVGPMAVAQPAEVAAPPAQTAAPPAKVASPGKAAQAGGEIVVIDPTTTGGTPAGKQIYAKDRGSAVASCKALCPNGGTLTPSIPPSDYWYCTCKSASTN